MTEQALRTEIASLRAHVAGLENQIVELNGECKHEWRTQWRWDYDDQGARKELIPDGYFCVHCLKGHD